MQILGGNVSGKTLWPIVICGAQFEERMKNGSMSVVGLAPAAARLGAQGVEFREVYWKNKAEELPKVREQVRALGLVGTYATFTTLFNRDVAKQQQLMQDLEDAHAIGSPLMRVFQGEKPGAGPEDAHMWQAARAALERAAGYGMYLALENFIGTPGNHWREVKSTIEDLNSPVLAVNIDTSNYVLNGHDLMEAIRELFPWVRYSHLKDVTTVDGKKAATYPGNGELSFKAILGEYNKMGRRFPLCLEFRGGNDPEGEITKTLEHLRGVM